MRPSRAAASKLWFTVVPDTMSTTRFTPLSPVAFFTCSGHVGSVVSIARSQPYSLSRARRPAWVEVPITSDAPLSLPICMPISPTPELAPWISSVSPAFRRPAVTTALCMVCSATGKHAACS